MFFQSISKSKLCQQKEKITRNTKVLLVIATQQSINIKSGTLQSTNSLAIRQLDLVCQFSLCVWGTVKLLNLCCVMFDVSSKPCFINLLAAENNLSPSALVSGFSIFVTGINDMQIAKVLLSLE